MNIQAQRDFIDRRQLVSALRALRRGDFSVRLPEDADGVDAEIASLFNEVVSLNEEMTQEFERLSKVVGKEGKISQRGRVKNARGGWEIGHPLGQRAHRGHGAADSRSVPRHRRGR